VLTVAAAAGPAGASSKTGFAALNGKRIAGTKYPWLPIANPYVHPKDIGGTSTPPLTTSGSQGSVSFFDFSSKSKATTFYNNPPVAARIDDDGVEWIAPLAGATEVGAPSKWVDLQECLYTDPPAVASVVGEPSGGKVNASGTCTSGALGHIGFAEVIQRGKVVVLVATFGGVNGSAGIQGAIDVPVVTLNESYAKSALSLMKKAHLT
jgi:hypothetical protein